MTSLNGWGAAREMSALEATMWRAEAEPQLRSGGVVVEHLDTVPEWDRLLAGHAWAIEAVPRLRQRVVDDPLRLGPPVWAECDVDLAYHVRRDRIGTAEELLEVAAALHMSPFDSARPLWEAVLVEGLPDGRGAYLLKLHHSVADGTAVIQLFDLLHSDRREATREKRVVGAPAASGKRSRLGAPAASGKRSPLGAPAPAEVAVRHALDAARASVGRTARLVHHAARLGARAARHPESAAAAAARFGRSLARVSGPPPAAPSPLMRERGLSRRLRALAVDARDLRAAGKAAGGTLNDAFLAALAGGFRRYHAEHGIPVGELPMALPVSLRGNGDPAGGNRFAAARIRLPCGELDPALRVGLIGERVLAARREPALDFLGMTAPATSRLPSPLLTRLMIGFTHSIDLQASNFRGLDRPAYIAGARVDGMYVFGPAPGCGMMATLVSHQGVCSIGLTMDPAAVVDPDLMASCVREGFDEVLALAHDGVAR